MATRAKGKRQANPSASEPPPPVNPSALNEEPHPQDEEVILEDASDDPAEEQAGHSGDIVLPPLPGAGGTPSVAADNDVADPSALVPLSAHANLGLPPVTAPLRTVPSQRPPAVHPQQTTFDQYSAEEGFVRPHPDPRNLKRAAAHQVPSDVDEGGVPNVANAALQIELRNILAQTESLERYKRSLDAKRRHTEQPDPTLQAQVHEAGLRLKAVERQIAEHDQYEDEAHEQRRPPAHSYLFAMLDPSSPIADFIQLTPHPPGCRLTNLPVYRGLTDPKKFLFSYEAAVFAAGGDESTLAKSFCISLGGVAESWYSKLAPGSIKSCWTELRAKFVLNFQGCQPTGCSVADLKNCKQAPDETLQQYFQRFLSIKAQLPEVSEGSAIDSAIEGLQAGPLFSKCSRRPPKTLQELHEVFRKYIIFDEAYHKKLEAQRGVPRDTSQSRSTKWPRGRKPDPSPQDDTPSMVNSIESAPPP
jgi:hypothetical protein